MPAYQMPSLSTAYFKCESISVPTPTHFAESGLLASMQPRLCAVRHVHIAGVDAMMPIVINVTTINSMILTLGLQTSLHSNVLALTLTVINRWVLLKCSRLVLA